MSVTVNSSVPKAIKGVASGTEKALIATAVKVATQAKALAPVDQGQLKGSLMWKAAKADGLHTEGNKLSESVKGLSAIVGTAVEHGVYQEYGTRHMAPQPYLNPAVGIVTSGSSYQKEAAKIMEFWIKNILPSGSGGAGLF